MEVQEVLEDIGLSQNEVKAYIALSKIGEGTANKIASIAKIHRTNTYDILDRLAQKGLVSHIHKQGTKYFRITDPDQLIFLLEEKKKQVEQILPKLKSFEMAMQQSYAEVVHSVRGFCNILENLLSYEEDILVYGIPKIAPERMKYFIPSYHKRRIAKKIAMKHIYNFNAKDRIDYLNTMELTYAAFLPQEFDSQVSTTICGKEVIFTLWSENTWSIRVKNQEITDSYKRYFGILWKNAKVA